MTETDKYAEEWDFEEGPFSPPPFARAYSIEVDGIVEAHADTRAEAVMVAGYLGDQHRGRVAAWCADTLIDWRSLHPIRPARERLDSTTRLGRAMVTKAERGTHR